jgi:UDP-glucose 4-epimerase
MKNLLITGGLGFIGSHTVCELYTNNKNFNVILDNLCNSSMEQITLIL